MRRTQVFKESWAHQVHNPSYTVSYPSGNYTMLPGELEAQVDANSATEYPKAIAWYWGMVSEQMRLLREGKQ